MSDLNSVDRLEASASASVSVTTELTNYQPNRIRRGKSVTFRSELFSNDDDIWGYGCSSAVGRRTTRSTATATASVVASTNAAQPSDDDEVLATISSSSDGDGSTCSDNFRITRAKTNLDHQKEKCAPALKSLTLDESQFNDEALEDPSDIHTKKKQRKSSPTKIANEKKREDSLLKNKIRTSTRCTTTNKTTGKNSSIQKLRKLAKTNKALKRITLPIYQQFENEFIHICEDPGFQAEEIRQVENLFDQACDILYKPGTSKADLNREFQYGFLHKKTGVFINFLGMQPDLVKLPRRVYDLDNLDE
jgi:hypothetical protein